MTEVSKTKLRNAVEKFEEVVREHAWLGAKHPEDQLEIERDYHRRKARLLAAMGLEYVVPVDEEDDN